MRGVVVRVALFFSQVDPDSASGLAGFGMGDLISPTLQDYPGQAAEGPQSHHNAMS